MKNHKNIDRLFQENLKGLDVTAPTQVWDNIEAKLTKKQKKKRGFWWLTSGVAAMLLLSFLLFPKEENKLDFNKINTNDLENSVTKAPDENDNVTKEIVVIEQDKKSETKKSKIRTPKKTSDSNVLIAQKRETTNHKSNQKSKISTNELTKKEEIIVKKIENNQIDGNESNALEDKKETPIRITSKKEDFITAIEKTDIEEKKKKQSKKWSISPTIAILNANSFTNSSPLDVNLSGSTSGKSSFSYGLKVAYQINDRWSVQTGLHQQEIGYQNNQIILSNATGINNNNVVFNSNVSFDISVLTTEASDVITIGSNSFLSADARLNQLISYYEIPLEISYRIPISEKLSTNVITGFSTLFLNNNEVELTSSRINEIGQANNLNDINFSGNLGVDVNYQMNKNWSIFINPMLKTQLNTFSNNSNGFRPFFIGLYSGIQLQF